jgi:hypothetical protein
MHNDDEQMDDFSARWEHAFGEKLTKGEARIKAGRIMGLYRSMLQAARG